MTDRQPSVLDDYGIIFRPFNSAATWSRKYTGILLLIMFTKGGYMRIIKVTKSQEVRKTIAKRHEANRKAEGKT